MNRLATLIVCLLLTMPAWSASKPPNVLILLTDDQGLGDFSFQGNPHLKTPNLDEFARQSVRLTDFHVAPMCSPTRGQLMTGLAALRNGATSVTAGRTFLRPGLKTLPQQFAKKGYTTGLFGKWHLGDTFPHRPMDKGFQQANYHLGWGQLHSTPEFDWPLIDGRYFDNGIQKRYKGHCTDVWFEQATDFMKDCQQKEQPFFCYLATNAPHAPHIDLPQYIQPYEGRNLPAAFFGMIAHIDKCFGDLDAFLTQSGLKENTIVVFMTDNGGTAGVNVFNAGLRGRKTMYYEGGHRVPCWIRWPAGQYRIGPPRDVDFPTDILDLFPTLCELCDLDRPTWQPDEELYHGEVLFERPKVAAKDKPALAVNPRLRERFHVVQYGQIPKKYDCCVIWKQWRLVHGNELYDVAVDRAQSTDVAAQHPDIVKQMRDYYEKWWAGVEPLLNDFVPQTIGSKVAPVVELTSGDWENIYADNTGFVREAVGGPTGGRWHLNVEAAGEYEFTLRRWPEIAKTALGEKYPPSAKSPPNKPKIKTVGFPTIAVAKLEIAGVSAQAKANPKQESVTIPVTLPAGRTTLKAWFADQDGKDLCGAFFVTVTKK